MDTDALDAATIYSSAINLVRQDLASGIQSEGSLIQGIKYPLRRLAGMQVISDEDREQIGTLADAVGTGGEISQLVTAIQERSDASPLAVALADLSQAAAADTTRKEQNLLVLAGAIAAAYVSFQLPASGGADRPPAMDSIVAAAGGAVAVTAAAFIRELEAQLPPRA